MLSKFKELREEREEGFTLIELLVVILIIGILSAIAIPAFLNQRKSAVDASVQSDVSNAAKQIETWVVKQGAQEKTIDTAAVGGMSIKKSDGTVLTVKGSSFNYCVLGTNPGGDVAATASKGFAYKSQGGGLVVGASDCTGTYGASLPAPAVVTVP